MVASFYRFYKYVYIDSHRWITKLIYTAQLLTAYFNKQNRK